MEDEYLTVRNAAERLHVTRQAIYNWIADGRLKAVKLGKSVRIPVSSLLAFMEPVKPGERIVDEEDAGQMVPALVGV